MLEFIRETWLQLVDAIVNFRIIADLIDILLISFLIYKAIGFLRDSRGGQLVKGLLILVVVSMLASILKLTITQWLITSVIDSLVIALAIIFQPELRRMLERVGRTNFTHSQGNANDEVSACIDAMSKALVTLQEKKTGALIVFERTTQLGEIIDTGTILDASASVSLINNVFFPKSPLHDGAVIIREGKIYAAGCILPLTQREDLSLQLGTRHRAAIGMTENSDAVVLVVSEETGIISIAVNGHITRNYNPISAGAELKNLMVEQKNLEKQNTFSKIFSRFKSNKNKEGEELND